MEEIQNGKEKKDAVVAKAAIRLEPVLTEMKKHQETMGQELAEAAKKAQMQQRIVGSCLQCRTGKLVIVHSRRTGKRFLGCTGYFKGQCKASFPLPQTGTVKPVGKVCGVCGWPMIQYQARGKRPWVFCVRPDCPSKEARR